jgi:hypothetical protein
MDAEGIPVPLVNPEAPGLQGLLQQAASQPKAGPPLLAFDEETAARMQPDHLQQMPYVVDLGSDSLATLLRQLNQAQLTESLREGGPVEVRHHGQRYILALAAERGEPDSSHSPHSPQSPLRMGALKELNVMTAPRQTEAAISAKPPPTASFHGVMTNVSAARLPAATVMEWVHRARMARAAFSPVQIITTKASGNGVLNWRNNRNLQFLTHWLRCHLHAEWRARAEARPVEEVLRELQEVHRMTLMVDGIVVRRTVSHPSKAVAALLTKLNLWGLFES